jgi:hypothetical protein
MFLIDPSHTLRPRLVRLAGLLAAPLAGCALLAGCQSTSQSDLIAREMRMQEDKIYALQDYLSEYQQLLCQYRQENEALREQLGTNGPGSTSSSGTSPRSSSPRGIRPPQEAPRAPANGSGNIPDVPELTIPPLDNQSGAGDSPIQLTSYQEDSAPGYGSIESRSERAERAFLSGETIASEEGEPRILVDVAPLSAAGRGVVFHGSLSLMILTPSDAGPPRSLARWDYSPEQAQAAKEESPDRYAMRFRLQLPNDLPIERPAELWVRLIREDGTKVLAKAPLSLDAPRSFASAPFAAESNESSGDERPAELGVVVQSAPTDEGWAIAKPGETVIATPGLAGSAGEWRVATQPLPEITSSPVAKPVAPDTLMKQDRKNAIALRSREPALPPAWSPERDSAKGLMRSTSGRSEAGQEIALPAGWSPDR